MKIEHIKIGSLIRVNDTDSENHLKYGVINSMPVDDISGYIKIIIDTTGFHELFTQENWFLPSSLDLINP